MIFYPNSALLFLNIVLIKLNDSSILVEYNAPPDFKAWLWKNSESITYNSILLMNRQTPKVAMLLRQLYRYILKL